MKNKSLILIVVILLISILSSISYSLNDWYEGYKLEPYYYKSYNPLVKQYSNDLILDLLKNRCVARGEYPISNLLTYNNRVRMENGATEDSIKNLVNSIGQLRVSADQRLYNLTRNSTLFAEAVDDRVRKTYSALHYRIFTMKKTLRVTSAVKYKGPNSLLNVVYPYLIEKEILASFEAAAIPAAENNEDSGTNDGNGGGLFSFLFNDAESNDSSTIESIQVTLESESSLEAADDVSINKLSDIKIKGSYTGLIIDARNLNIEPAIDPQIVDKNGNIAYYKISDCDLNLLYERGKTGYETTIDSAYKNYRSGKNPLLIKATSAVRSCDPVVSEEDAYRIIEENKKSGFLDKLSVIIVI